MLNLKGDNRASLNSKKRKILALTIPALVVLIIDQYSKYLIRTVPELQNMTIVEGWFAFHYTRNPGMAMGIDLLSTPVISVIAICAVVGIFAYVIYHMEHANMIYMGCMGLVIGGALGNIIDRLILAKIESYGGILEGHVVDFLHFTLEISGYPVFHYIFNIADTAISVAIILLLLFNKQIMPREIIPVSNSTDQEQTSPENNTTNINNPEAEDSTSQSQPS